MGLTALQDIPHSSTSLSKRLISTLSEWRYEDLPAVVITRVKLFLLDTLGVIGAASSQREVTIVNRRLERWATGGRATALLGKRSLPAPFAALANGTAAHALDFDDIHDAARVHNFAVLLPALLAVAEDRGGISGKNFLLALALGTDLNARLGLAAPRALPIGWHPSTIFGVIAGGYAAARLLGLDVNRQLGALGFAHHLAAGSSESIVSGAPSKRIGLGFAAQSAVMAVGLAEDGISGPAEFLTGRSGLFALQQRGEADPTALLRDFGTRWEVLNYQFKAYPCCRCCHSTISLGIDLHRDGLRVDDIAQIAIVLPRVNAETVGAPYDASRNSASHAQFNAAFCFAAALADGAVGVSTFTPPRFSDPVLVALAARTRVSVDPVASPDAMEPSRVRLELKDGSRLERAFDIASVTFDEAVLRQKFRTCLSQGLDATDEQLARLEDIVLGLDDLTDVAALVDAFP